MSSYTPTELIQRWKNGTIDTTQAVGHILQHLVAIAEQQALLLNRINALTKLLETPEGSDAPPAPPPKRRRKP
jgi:hypothetical protein